MPAAAVTPAPIAYIKVVAVKKLVVGYLAWAGLVRLSRKGWVCTGVCFCHPSRCACLFAAMRGGLNKRVWIFYFEKIRVFKAGGNAVNTLAWNNEIGLWFYFVGL